MTVLKSKFESKGKYDDDSAKKVIEQYNTRLAEIFSEGNSYQNKLALFKEFYENTIQSKYNKISEKTKEYNKFWSPSINDNKSGHILVYYISNKTSGEPLKFSLSFSGKSYSCGYGCDFADYKDQESKLFPKEDLTNKM